MPDNADAAAHLDSRSCRLVAEFFSLLANPTRVSILCALQEGRKSVSEIAEYAGISMQNASQHLRLMRDKGAVYTEKEAQRVYYSVVDPQLLEGCKQIRDALAKQLQHRADSVDLVRMG